MKDLDCLVEETTMWFGKVDALFLNAGIAPFAPVEASDEAFFDRCFNINVAIFRSHPDYQAPSRLLDELRRLIEQRHDVFGDIEE